MIETLINAYLMAADVVPVFTIIMSVVSIFGAIISIALIGATIAAVTEEICDRIERHSSKIKSLKEDIQSWEHEHSEQCHEVSNLTATIANIGDRLRRRNEILISKGEENSLLSQLISADKSNLEYRYRYEFVVDGKNGNAKLWFKSEDEVKSRYPKSEVVINGAIESKVFIKEDGIKTALNGGH